MDPSSRSAALIRKFKDKPKPGDLIQIFRGDDNHWAVSVGGGNVVHFVPAGDGSNSSGVVGKVLKQKLQDVVEKDKWRVNNLLDYKYTPLPVNDIVREARSLVDTRWQYDLDTYNSEHFATELRYGKPEAKPGDLIEIFRRWYQHWAVSVGDGDVVHFVQPGWLARTGVVLMQKLEDVVKKDKWKVNNLLDHKYTPRSADDIVEKARSMVDTEMDYNMKEYNCEHFANEMRYGKPESRQVKDKPALVNAASGLLGSYRSMKNSGVRPLGKN
ncbi:phospholipase A and acyltransferase 3-like [Cololabis saira]|uniref:phospholipase A and acyltransferase 3-like n=1 Tax=Cololabis saira TaxID=129043 RepID=UPI002AD50B3D|nr:phospholipase A and acyltransferase 3-like [Cololabis saira]